MRGFFRQPLARGREGLDEIEILIDLARSRRRDRAAGTGGFGGVRGGGSRVLLHDLALGRRGCDIPCRPGLLVA